MTSEYTPDEGPLIIAYAEGGRRSSTSPSYEARMGAAFRAIARVKAEAWDDGHSWGWSDAQDAHDVRQVMDRTDWPKRTPNPYRKGMGDE